MYWYCLLFSAAIDVIYGVSIYHSKGFTLIKPSALAVCAAVATSYFLALAMKGIPAGVSFMVWSGLASLGVAIYGVFALGEAANLPRLAMMALILVGVGGLKLMPPG